MSTRPSLNTGKSDKAGNEMFPSIISVERVVEVPIEHARAWFLSLKDHPERYRFDTHDGIEFVQGDFGDVGSRFTTREKFYFLKLSLLFELVEVSETSFSFRLIRPAWFQVWGAFRLNQLSSESVSLRLEIGSATRLGQSWLAFYPLAAAIRQQITREVVHIRSSMESTLSSDVIS
jgi:hypothetical protein